MKMSVASRGGATFQPDVLQVGRMSSWALSHSSSRSCFIKKELARGQKCLQALQCTNAVVETELLRYKTKQNRLTREREEHTGNDKAPSHSGSTAPFTLAAAFSTSRLWNGPKSLRN